MRDIGQYATESIARILAESDKTTEDMQAQAQRLRTAAIEDADAAREHTALARASFWQVQCLERAIKLRRQAASC